MENVEGQKVACLLGPGFEDSELEVPRDRLTEAGATVEIIGRHAGEDLAGYHNRVKVRTERSIDQASPGDYDALVIPGGYSPDVLRADPRFVEFVRRFDAIGKPLAAVCHGPQLLITARLVRRRTLTAWKTIREDLRQAGANVVNEPVVIDGNWITSREPGDLEAFSDALIHALGPEPRLEPAEVPEEEIVAPPPPSESAREPTGMAAAGHDGEQKKE